MRKKVSRLHWPCKYCGKEKNDHVLDGYTWCTPEADVYNTDRYEPMTNLEYMEDKYETDKKQK